MGGGGGRGPARPQVGGCRQERAPLGRRGAQRRAGRMVPAPGPGAACERGESVVSGEPRERRSRRRARFWRSRFGTSQHPEEGREARDHLPAERGRDISSPPPPSLSSAPLRRGLGGGGVPRRWSRFVAKANPLMPRSLGRGRRARPAALGLLGREEVVGESRARKGKNPFHDQGRRQQHFYSPEKCLLLEMIFTLFLKSTPSLLVFAGDVTNRSRPGRREHELSSGTCDSRDLLQFEVHAMV
ncbi:uncharacterized protein LOC128938972 [Melozone crissalis]|uniref:uncharacterized protein LOC128938972 n=1 Tax=Melozone crissalis TaxID=40204 RepID=UPI0023DBF3CB|nr:uncharacterized protein LOC128938972 [Melozone crissalis]